MMALQLLQQVLILMILVLIYLAGGYIALQTKDELKTLIGYVKALVAIAGACIVGLVVYDVSNIYAGIIVGIGVFILGKLIKDQTFYFSTVILSGAIIFQTTNIIGAAVVMVLMQGIMDYDKLKEIPKKKKTKSKSKKEVGMTKYDAFLIRVVQIIIIPLIILVIYSFVV